MIEDALVVVPAFNEASAISETLAELAGHASQALVVDDGSSDRTAELARGAGAMVLKLATNLNYGGALQAGFRFALRKTGLPYVVTFDADGQHSPEHIDLMLEELRSGRADYVIGSRYLGGPGHGSLVRGLGIRMFSKAVSLATGKRVTDPTSGLIAMNREVARALLLDLFPQDYPDADVVIMLERMGFRVREVPVRMRPSRSGKSMHGGLVRPIFYILKMSLSILNLSTRGDLRAKRKEAGIAA